MDALQSVFQASTADGVDLDAVMRLVGQELLHYARLITGSAETAEDAVHDTLVALLQQGDGARKIESSRAWLFTVLRRKALTYRKRIPLQFAAAFTETVEGDPAQRLILAEALAALSQPEQETIVLHLWDGLTFEEISEVLDAPRGTILSRYHRAVARLRERLGGLPETGTPVRYERSAV
ncbi:MAG TPA: RNA polymerase sigma factor [Planctomycetota bacterium]|nr:RNA polymerase sigma factor [Planctomycetota bacterium]